MLNRPFRIASAGAGTLSSLWEWRQPRRSRTWLCCLPWQSHSINMQRSVAAATIPFMWIFPSAGGLRLHKCTPVRVIAVPWQLERRRSALRHSFHAPGFSYARYGSHRWRRDTSDRNASGEREPRFELCEVVGIHARQSERGGEEAGGLRRDLEATVSALRIVARRSMGLLVRPIPSTITSNVQVSAAMAPEHALDIERRGDEAFGHGFDLAEQ